MDPFREVDVWVGRFPSREAADACFAETYAEGDDDDPPISSFAADMGEVFYDHDFVERAYLDPSATDFAAALAPHSWSSSYLAAAAAAFAADPLLPFDTLLCVWNREIGHPVSVERPGVTLRYLGRFGGGPGAGTAS